MFANFQEYYKNQGEIRVSMSLEDAFVIIHVCIDFEPCLKAQNSVTIHPNGQYGVSLSIKIR